MGGLQLVLVVMVGKEESGIGKSTQNLVNYEMSVVEGCIAKFDDSHFYLGKDGNFLNFFCMCLY